MNANVASMKPMVLVITERPLIAALPIVAFLHPFCIVEVNNTEVFLVYRTRHFGSAAQKAKLLECLKNPRPATVRIKSADDLSVLMPGTSISQMLLEATGEIAPSTNTEAAEEVLQK